MSIYPDDTLVDSIHEFELWNIPVSDWPMFALSTTSIVDSGLGGMKFVMRDS